MEINCTFDFRSNIGSIGNLLLRIKVTFVCILATSAKCRGVALIELGGCSVEDGSFDGAATANAAVRPCASAHWA